MLNTPSHPNVPGTVFQPLPRDPNRALEEMAVIIKRLMDVYKRETKALEDLDSQGFLAEQEEKSEAARAYQHAIGEIVARKDEIRTANPDLKLKLEMMQDGFSELARVNMKALKRMQKTMDRLGNTIRRIAKEETEKHRTFSYGANGTMQTNTRKGISTGLSETA